MKEIVKFSFNAVLCLRKKWILVWSEFLVPNIFRKKDKEEGEQMSCVELKV